MKTGDSSDHRHVTEADVRSMVSLLADIAMLSGDHTAKKKKLLSGLCELINADKWVWVLRLQSDYEKAPDFMGYLQGGFTPEECIDLTKAAAHPCVEQIEASLVEEMKHHQCHITRRLEDIDTRKNWQGSPAAKLAEKAGVSTFISSTHPLGTDKFSVVAMYRANDKKSFSERDRRIAHIILTEVKWLHSIGWPEDASIDAISSLPKSLMRVLSMMVHGHNRDAIATILELKINTVNSYIKEVFRHFNVSSQVELMRHFIHGDGNDQISLVCE